MKLKKKGLLVFAAILALAGVGTTLAYFTSTSNFSNVFNTSRYYPEVKETFESPSDWTPGTTTDKKVEVTNSGSVPIVVRAKYTEAWKDNTNTSLPLTDKNGTVVSVINFNNDGTWVKSGDYYYYTSELTAGAKSTSFIESVTFNKDTDLSIEYETIKDGNTTLVRPKSLAGNYTEATYTLDIVVETMQADQAETAWGVDVTTLR